MDDEKFKMSPEVQTHLSELGIIPEGFSSWNLHTQSAFIVCLNAYLDCFFMGYDMKSFFDAVANLSKQKLIFTPHA